MLETDIRLLSAAKLADLAGQLGLRTHGSRGIWVIRKSLTDPRTHREHTLKRSTKTPDLRTAVHRASLWVDEFTAAVHGKLPTLETNSALASLERIGEHYQIAATCAPAVRRKNWGCLQTIVCESYPDTDFSRLSTDALDGRMVRRWQLQRKISAEKAHLPADAGACERAKRGANSCYRQARSVFSRALLRSYEDAGLRLPACVREFSTQGFLHAQPAPPSEQVPPATLARLVRCLPRLRTVRPGIYAAFLLMFRAGLRNTEAVHARWSWLNPNTQGGYTLNLHLSADYKPKTTSRHVNLTPDVYALLQQLRPAATAADPDPYIIPAATPHQRKNIVSRDLNRLLTCFGVHAIKGKIAYRLRGHAITEVILANGMDAAREFAGHSTSKTTEIYKGASVPYTPLAMPG